MHAASTSARRTRTHHRQSLHTLTYVILDEANGGIIRNLNHEGVAIQAVAALRLHQRVRVRFELRHPRVKIDAMGEVVWADVSGQCGIRFVDLSGEAVRQVNEWILGDLLDSIPSRTHSIFGLATGAAVAAANDDADTDAGFLLSSSARKVIQLQPPRTSYEPVSLRSFDPALPVDTFLETDWLSRLAYGRHMAWTLNSLIVVAGSLLVSLIFLVVTRDLPKWPLDLEAGFAAIIFVTAFYCLFFRALGGSSMGARLARLAGSDAGDGREARDSARFR